jgi:hypothetical protein
MAGIVIPALCVFTLLLVAALVTFPTANITASILIDKKIDFFNMLCPFLVFKIKYFRQIQQYECKFSALRRTLVLSAKENRNSGKNIQNKAMLSVTNSRILNPSCNSCFPKRRYFFACLFVILLF